MMKINSIRTRVIIMALVPTIVVSLLLGTFLIGSRISDLEKEQRINAVTLLNHIINISRSGVFKNDKQLLEQIIEILPEERDLESITIFDKNHQLLAYSGDDQFQAIAKDIHFSNDSATTFTHKDSMTLTAPIIIDDLKLYTVPNYSHLPKNTSHKQVIGWVSITISKAKTLLEEYQIIIFTLLLLALGVTLSTVFAIRTSNFFMIPMIKIRNGLKKMGQGALQTRIETHASGEIIILENTINQMAASLEQKQQQLHHTIEQKEKELEQALITNDMQSHELARAQKEVLDASRIKSEFIANMSHEIRTPMNSIVGYTNLLLETELTILQRNYLTTIQKSTLNLLNLINNVLDFSRLDAGQLKLDYIPFDLYDCIEDVISIMSPLANSKQLEFSVLIDKEVPTQILSDPLRIKQVIVNLVSNAIKFTQQGNITVHVSTEKKSIKSVKLRVEISDTGIGMTPQEQKGIFKAFQQADTSISRKYGGTGLGLAICKKLMDQLAGKIGVESEEGKGSTFWFTFTSENARIDTSKEIYIHDFQDQTAFIYEPNPIARESLFNLLTNWKIATAEFDQFDAFINQLKSTSHPHFVIAGINQQLIEDETASKYIYQIKEHFQGPLIILTNSSEQAILGYFTSQGALTAISKPFIRKNLFHVISQLSQPTKLPFTNFGNEPNLYDKHILCVDDNPHNANLIKALLESTHGNISIAHDGAEAHKMTEQEKYDLILMDIRMPKLDGYEAASLIRNAANKNHQTPIIAISAHISEEEQLDLKRAGFNDYLLKPIDKLTLFATIQHWIFLQMKQKNKHLKTVDWELALKLANNKKEVAEEMHALLIKSLPQDIQEIEALYEENNLHELQNKVHKLHGALCYCGVPILKHVSAQLETALKKKQSKKIKILMVELRTEVDAVISYHEENQKID